MKIAYGVLTAARKLKHYFQAHKIRVPTSHPLKEVLQSCKSSRRLEKWATKLSQHYIEIEKTTSVKSEVLADFVTAWTPSQNPSEEQTQPEWIIHCDGAWSFAGASVVAIITSLLGVKMRYTTRLEFQCTNNITEYEAVLLGLQKARAMGIKSLIIKTDS